MMPGTFMACPPPGPAPLRPSALPLSSSPPIVILSEAKDLLFSSLSSWADPVRERTRFFPSRPFEAQGKLKAGASLRMTEKEE